jgi:hypothetical protein
MSNTTQPTLTQPTPSPTTSVTPVPTTTQTGTKPPSASLYVGDLSVYALSFSPSLVFLFANV